MSATRASSARVRHKIWPNTPIHTIVCTNSNSNTNKKSSFEAIIHHPRRLGSGSACERCRSRKTKCDGGQPCSFCASHNIQCVHRQSKKKRNPYGKREKLNGNLQLPSLYREYRNQTAEQFRQSSHFSQRKPQSSYFFDTVIKQDSIKISDGSSTDSSISSIYSMHVPEDICDKQTQAKSAALFTDDPHPESWSSLTANIKMPSIMDQLSCHTFTLEAVYSSCSNTWQQK